MQVPSSYIVSTAAESRQIDTDTIEQFGIDGFTLMEVAGHSAAQTILTKLAPASRGVILCGKGNNGGDALVVARYLVQHGHQLTVVFIDSRQVLSGSAQKNYQLLQKVAQNGDTEVTFINEWTEFNSSQPIDFIIDGMLGTGLNSTLRGDYVHAVQWANNQGLPTYAMDIPTGLHADTGAIMGNAIIASQTFAFGTLKQGFYLGEGYEHTGSIKFCELPFPHHLKRKSTTFLMDEGWTPENPRLPAPHKYAAGVVYIVAGSEGLAGAAIMAAKSAWAAGLGAVILLCPRGLLPTFETKLPQIIKKPIGSRSDFYLTKDHFEQASSIVHEKEGVLLIGPGIGRQPQTVSFTNNLLSRFHGRCIIDADALWALAQTEHWNRPKQAYWTLTPHPGELAHLLKDTIKDDASRLKQVRELANQKKVTILSKGFPVIVGTKTAGIYLSGYDNRMFSRAGFGDVLAGKISAYQALGYQTGASCIKALLEGYQKAATLLSQAPSSVIEPFDLL